MKNFSSFGAQKEMLLMVTNDDAELQGPVKWF